MLDVLGEPILRNEKIARYLSVIHFSVHGHFDFREEAKVTRREIKRICSRGMSKFLVYLTLCVKLYGSMAAWSNLQMIGAV